ncbi:uncharacterized protein CTRU02_211745 [Colletotrichum truncatum]|uniref:Uncharacterized protein n=1 Tax=Colletotrichum truncatum TaxID=5467 RepID=A0ACC3YLV0_COLTU|nr:uncharacterized protein CTRU02_14737 [Colletotrichum truncatum]KAF6781860.1 hypothetical protein CTRU02_14737 [Colletotrichum truncatum]
MPTVTSTSQVAITNIGPLTTVFTAPASCATASPNLWLAITQDEFPSRVAPFYKRDCIVPKLGECYASGKKLDDAYASVQSVGTSDIGTIAYFSPASACPDSHTTVGVASKGNDGNITSSGIFMPTAVASSEDSRRLLFGQNPPLNLLMQVLDKNETAVICCPQDYTIDFQGGACYSSVPLSMYGERTACYLGRNPDDYTAITATFTYNNSAVAGVVWSITVPSQSFSTVTTTLTESAITESFYAVVAKPAYTLIHGGAAASVQPTTDDAAATGTAAPTQTGANAANSLRMMATSGGGVGVLATVWAFAALAGVALALPL